ncbi:ADP-ribosylglycohydrolase family protein [Planctomycetota bacterium]
MNDNASDAGQLDRITGLVLGTAVGDALGLPAEGMTRGRIRKLFGETWSHHFLARRGMLSDDTEHTLFVCQALLAASGDPAAFQRLLARKLRWWLLGLPAGIGLATLRAILKLWCGFSPDGSGVFSAGNGAAMRSAPIGAYFAGDAEKIKTFTIAATRLTHTDPRALTGALAIALLAGRACSLAATNPPPHAEILDILKSLSVSDDEEWPLLLQHLEKAINDDLTVSEFAAGLGLEKGVSGYVYHTVPVAIFAWLRHFGDFRLTLESVLSCGGDTDTIGAIAGALSGSTVGKSGIPEEWLEGIIDWPRSTTVLAETAARLDRKKNHGEQAGPAPYFWPALLPRNILFLAVVLAHGFRRLLPPY